MQERRTLVYIKEEDIPASATVVDFSNVNVTGNVLYVPIYGTNKSGNAYFPAYTYGSETTHMEAFSFEAVDISTFPASVAVSVGDTGSSWSLYCNYNIITFGYPFVKSGDRYGIPHVFDIRGSSYGIILMPIAQSFYWLNGASGWVTNSEGPIYPNGYIKLRFTNTKIRLKYTRDDTFIQFDHPIYIDTE